MKFKVSARQLIYKEFFNGFVFFSIDIKKFSISNTYLYVYQIRKVTLKKKNCEKCWNDSTVLLMMMMIWENVYIHVWFNMSYFFTCTRTKTSSDIYWFYLFFFPFCIYARMHLNVSQRSNSNDCWTMQFHLLINLLSADAYYTCKMYLNFIELNYIDSQNQRFVSWEIRRFLSWSLDSGIWFYKSNISSHLSSFFFLTCYVTMQ